MAKPEFDMLNPFVSFEWEESCSLPVNMRYPGQAVCLNNKVYYGGGTSDNREDDTKLYVCDLLAMDTWKILEVPVCDFALASFQCQLVLIGGYLGKKRTNKLYVLNHDNCVVESLPPMSMKRSCAVALGYNTFLIVAGGIHEDMPVSDVEIFDSLSKQWSSVQPLPEPSHDMKSAVHDGKLYFFGCGVDGTNVYYMALESLVTNSLESEEAMQPITDQTMSWNSLSENPLLGCSVTKFGNRLLSIGGEIASQKPSSAIHVYHQSWIYAGNFPLTLGNACVVVLPSGELMVVGGVTENFSISNSVFKGHIRLLPPRLDAQFSLDSLSRMEVVADVSILTNEEISTWVKNENPSERTWNRLLQLLKEHNMAHEAENILKYFMALTAGMFASEGTSKEEATSKDEDLIAQLTESEEIICQLAQKIAVLTNDIQKLKHENKHLTVRVESLKRQLVKSTGGDLLLYGVEMCDETKVFVTNSPQQFYWEDYGLKLCFPDGCLPSGVDDCAMTVTVSLGGQYQFPEESHLVSAVFWLRSEPSIKFAKPILVEIQHCARKENMARLSFVRSHCNQKQLPYTFKKLETGGAVFSENSSFGVIQLNRFSGFGIVQNGCDEREYCANLYYLDGKHSSVHIDFVVTWNTAAHRNVAQDHYSSKQAIQGPHSLIEFDADEISLDIPMEGIIIDDCWKVLPLARPVVTKRQVDGFQSGKLIPCCQLKAKVISQKPAAKDLTLQLNLIGAKHPYNIFTIDFEHKELLSSSLKEHSNKKYVEAEKPNLKDLLSELLSKIAHEWENIGILLEIDDGTLKNIEKSHNCDAGACFREMLRTWLMKISPPPTWSAIIEAIEKLGNEQLAKDLKEKCS